MFPCTRYLCLYNYITTAGASPAVQFKKKEPYGSGLDYNVFLVLGCGYHLQKLFYQAWNLMVTTRPNMVYEALLGWKLLNSNRKKGSSQLTVYKNLILLAERSIHQFMSPKILFAWNLMVIQLRLNFIVCCIL
jgi:hypothetical protein